MSNGIILQRFPEKDWSDTPFIEGIEWVITLQIRKYFLMYNLRRM
jgi:myotubularin-related protein 5/13